MAPKLYSSEWFEQRRSGARRSAEVIVPMLFDFAKPRTVVDVGCGTGSFLAVARELGAAVRGIDGDYVDRSQLEIPEDDFVAHDLTRPLEIDEQFDLALCLEVGEHLPPGASDGLVSSLVRLAPIVAFSAAIPGQTGTGHINVQWQDEWAARFRAHGYEASDVVRPRVWDSPDVRYCYAQNLLLYFDPQRVSVPPAHSLPLRIVHPRLLEAAGRTLPPPRDALRHVRQAALTRVRRVATRSRRA